MTTYYYLNRLEDSGTGLTAELIAEVVVGRQGTAIILWLEEGNSVSIYRSLADLEKIHGHGGKIVLEQTELTDDRRKIIIDRLEIASRKAREVAWGMTGGAIGFSSNFA